MVQRLSIELKDKIVVVPISPNDEGWFSLAVFQLMIQDSQLTIEAASVLIKNASRKYSKINNPIGEHRNLRMKRKAAGVF